MQNIIQKLQHAKLGLLLAASGAFFVLGGSQLRADDWGGHQRYDRDGFYDGQRNYHQYDHYRSHRGYWDQRNGTRIFINLG